MELTNKKWKAFKLSSIFEVENCKCSNVSNLRDGNIPYIGATNRNNGLLKFVEYNENLITKGNCIAFICDGEGSVGTSIYKKEDFIGSTTVKVGRNEKLNSYVGFFITTVADKVRSKYNFGFKRNDKHLKNEMLLLPINSKGEPDCAFMENYMKKKETELLMQYEKQVSEVESVVPLSEKEWKEFKTTDIFSDIQRGKRLKKDDHKSGVMPYVSSTGINNGVDGFVGNKENVRIFSNCLTLANSGSVGATFYQPFSFVASDHITKLENNKFNAHIYLFIANMMSRFSEKYSFNREINDTRIKKEKILLPTNTKNEPDYVYMENYMKALESEKIKEYLKYRKKKTKD